MYNYINERDLYSKEERTACTCTITVHRKEDDIQCEGIRGNEE